MAKLLTRLRGGEADGRIGEIACNETFQVSETWKVFTPTQPRQPKPPRAILLAHTAERLLHPVSRYAPFQGRETVDW